MLTRNGDVMHLHVVVEDGEAMAGVDEERVGAARMIDVMDDCCYQRSDVIHRIHHLLNEKSCTCTW